MLADTPRDWPNGPSLSTLHVLLIFGGIPLLVIVAVSLMVLAPGWVSGPRYRPGMPWQARSEWFGPTLSPEAAESTDPAVEASARTTEPAPQASVEHGGGPASSGGASAGW